MRAIEIKELKKIQIEILKNVHEFCIDNEIKYFLDCGTLIGAIRHKGYIPWDDDVDIGMLRSEYKKFVDTFNKKNKNKRYKMICVENDDDYCCAFGKVVDTKTVLYEPNKQGRKIAVYIDVFVYDNASKNDFEVKKQYKIRDMWRALNTAHSLKNEIGTNIGRKIAFNILHYLTKPFPKNFFAKKMAENAQIYNYKETGRVGNFTAYTVMLCEKEVFSSYIDWEFEGKFYKIPIGYDKWLRASYGDYMKIPPEKERKSTHIFEAYYLDA